VFLTKISLTCNNHVHSSDSLTSKRAYTASIFFHSYNFKLLLPLQAATHTIMDKISELCDRRFCELELEPGGRELLDFFNSPGEAAQLQSDILRQDHPKV
jgi:hypothetical protein